MIYYEMIAGQFRGKRFHCISARPKVQAPVVQTVDERYPADKSLSSG